MSEMELTCPSGLRGTVRGLKGRDFRSFNRQAARSGEGLTKVIAGCWVETLDPGIYKLSGGTLNWDDVLVGDHIYTLIGIRHALYAGTEEEKYTFKTTCKEQRCRQPIDWQIHLLDELPMKPLPESSKEALLEGRVDFEHVVAPIGIRVFFRLPTGRDQRRQKKVIQEAVRGLRGDDRPSDLVLSLASRMIRVEGLDGSEDFMTRVDWLEELDAVCHRNMLRGFDAADCGVDTTIEVQCQSCFAVQGVELPFDESFLMPR